MNEVKSINKETKEFIITNDFNIHNLTITKDTTLDVVVKDGVKTKLIEVLNVSGVNNNIVNIDYNLTLEENSSLDLVTIYCGDNANIIVCTKVLDNAYLNSMKLSSFSGNINVSGNTYLKYRAHNEDYNVFINSNRNKQEFSYNVHHEEKESESNMKNYAICKNDSILNVNTNGLVLRGAKESVLNQKSKGILLSKESAISANPLLQIDEFDCLASHGAGIGAIDEEDLFYLMSRGLTRSESEKLIIKGFINPIQENLEQLSNISNIDNIKNEIKDIIKLFNDLINKYL